jgi:hypothetical protein
MTSKDLPTDDHARPTTLRPDDAGRASGESWWSELPVLARAIQVRLRMVAVFVVAFLVVGNWETLSNYWDRLTTFATNASPQAVSANTEYFCPMCPGVISDWPSKCPVCNMALVRRKKGGPAQLPDGVVSRMQYSPYRLQLAGVRTSEVGYLPLARELTASGFLQAAGAAAEDETAETKLHVEVPLSQNDAAMLRAGQAVQIDCPALPGQGPWPARVRGIEFERQPSPLQAQVIIDIDSNPALSPGMEVLAHFHLPVAELEPFCSQPTDPEPLAATESRKVFVCPEHGDVLGDAPGACPRDKLPLVERTLADNERLRYWCPMHPEVTASQPGHKCDECGGMFLVPRLVTYRPHGNVLAVPASAVINTGKQHVVYIDRGQGMFDGVEVVVGPRAEGCYAIVSGLQAGQKIASAGAFLLDAETRLNPNTSAAYFGATTNREAASAAPASVPAVEQTTEGAKNQAQIEAALAQLAPEDEPIARRQRICPVTRMPLGSMGKPERIVVEGRVVFLCCAGCSQAVIDDPDKYLPSIPVYDHRESQP